MKLTFPPKKIQIRLAVLGAGVGFVGGILVVTLLKVCMASTGTVSCYLATFFTCVFMYIPVWTIGRICALSPSLFCLLLTPTLFFATIFYVFGNIFWIFKERSKNKKSDSQN